MAETTTLKALREAIGQQLGLCILTAIDVVVDGDTYTINSLADEMPDAERARDTFLYQGGVFRRIVSFGYPANNNVELARTAAFTATAAEIYSMLTPAEFNGAINEALKELYFKERETIPLVANTYVYDMPAWMQQLGQLLSLHWRDTTAPTTNPIEEPVAQYTPQEDTNAVRVVIREVLRSVTTYELVVTGRRNYQALASDAATTTCPFKLIYAVGMSRVLQRLFQKYGKGIASLYGPKMVLAEREEATAKKDWLPVLAARDYVDEDGWAGPDTNEFFNSPSW